MAVGAIVIVGVDGDHLEGGAAFGELEIGAAVGKGLLAHDDVLRPGEGAVGWLVAAHDFLERRHLGVGRWAKEVGQGNAFPVAVDDGAVVHAAEAAVGEDRSLPQDNVVYFNSLLF